MLAAITIILLILVSLVLWIALQNREQSKQIANLQNQINQQSNNMAQLMTDFIAELEAVRVALENIATEEATQIAEIKRLQDMVAEGSITPEMVELVHSLRTRAESISSIVEGSDEPVEGEENAGE